MRVLIYGAGAVGGYLGALFTDAGVDVTLVARGAQYEALSTRGVHLEWAEGRTLDVPVRVLRPGDLKDRYDVIFVTLKAMQLAAAAAEVASALAPEGSMVMVQNGLPWWYFERVGGASAGTALACLDRDGALAKGFDLDRVIGGVVYKPVTVQAPGRLFLPLLSVDELIIGEIDNRDTARCRAIAAMVSKAGFPTRLTLDIRREKWRKLMINLVWSPLCTLTQSPSGAIAAFPAGAELARAMMREGLAVARSVGVELDFEPEEELRRVAGMFTQQPSMLQDARAGRPLEWEPIVNAVVEMAALAQVPVPTLKNIAACLGLLDARIKAEGVAIAAVPSAQRTAA